MKYILLYIKQTLRFVLKPMSFLPAIFMMCLIFSFSAQDADESGELSYTVGREVISIANETFDQGWTAEYMDYLTENWQYYIRKAAHITEYFLLAVSVAFPLYVYGLRGIPLVLVAGSFCVGYACLDEFHQTFVSGRSPQKKDVMIDSIGIFAGIILTRIVGWTGRMTIFRPLSNSAKKKSPSGNSRRRAYDEEYARSYESRSRKKKYRSA
ncbi:MAG: VanZ family protein [Butyrivibrio sp.]|nr:VanZ family protein [Butyrivibrio sp.]